MVVGGIGPCTCQRVDSATSIPSINNSPWIRGAPHNGFSRPIRRISARISESICGRPPMWRDLKCQYARKPRRCQRITVSGWTMMIASSSDGYSRYSHTISKRSMFYSLTRDGDLRRRITRRWRRMRFSASSRARLVNCDRIASNSWIRNATIGRFHYHTAARASSHIRLLRNARSSSVAAASNPASRRGHARTAEIAGDDFSTAYKTRSHNIEQGADIAFSCAR